jgi:hypothetical protein
MSEKKINIDMGLFNFTKKSRKKNTGENKDGIKVKQPSQKKKNETIKKKSILKMIRQHQEDRYSKLFDEKKGVTQPSTEPTTGFEKDFDEAQKFMKNLTEKNVSNPQVKNKSLKNYSTNTNSLLFHPSIDPVKDVTNTIVQQPIVASPITLNPSFPTIINPSPQYGCLKNGQMPTYREYMNKTRKALPTSIGQSIGGGTPQQPVVPPKTMSEIRNEIVEKKINDSMNRVNEMKNIALKLQQLKQNNKPKKLKRKKTVRRTYKVGKSKIHPKVSVLVSNKTIRNNITTKSQLLKQTSIEEVKKHLINRGLIKIGTIAPNDVLRKMYESSILMCGELNNHNPDNLLYNFVNGAHN